VLHERADQSLDGMPVLAVFAIAMSVALPIVVSLLHRRVQARDAAQVAADLVATPVAAK
jgi:hypothetical protein